MKRVWLALLALSCGPSTGAKPSPGSKTPTRPAAGLIADVDEDADTDGDGIADVHDQCPQMPSNRTPPRDMERAESLGCPMGETEYDDGPPDDLDNDGYPNAEDACPTYAETFPSRLDGGCTDDGDGCPDGEPILLLGCDIAILDTLHYDAKQADLPAGGVALVKNLVVLLQREPELRFAVVGHTDDREPALWAERRAAGVVEALIAAGADAERLASRTAGKAEPVLPTRGLRGTELRDARAKNRRVSFEITQAPRLPGRPVPTSR